MTIPKLRTALLCVAALAAVPVVASATPGTGVTGTVLATGHAEHGIKVREHGHTDVVVRHITIQPGGSTGWHYHDGELIAVVEKGALTRTMDDCSVEVTTAGTSFVEPAGRRHVHIGRNLGAEPVELYVTYVLPAGSPLSEDAPAPRRC